MKALLKIPRQLMMTAMEDLERPHPFAGERLGFFSFRQSVHPERPLLLCYDYHPIADDHYIPDETCGGRIGGDAIRVAMGRSFREMSGQLWVHTHGRRGQPRASATDLAEGPKVTQSLANAQPGAIQGWAVISEEGTAGQIRALEGHLHRLTNLAVVGWPMKVPVREASKLELGSILGMLKKGGKRDTRYDRQSFLGEHSQTIFENAKVGIVGLGGGGSHINQQLAHIGFQRVVLCDGDRVEGTNLNRLVGATLQDVRKRRHKVYIANRLFKKLQPDAEIDDRPARWEEKREALRDCDLIFGCLDSFCARRDLEAFCRSLMIPLIDIGMAVLRPDGAVPEIIGQAIVSMPGEHCMHCLQFLTSENLTREAQRYDGSPQPQVVWPNGVLASTAVGYAVVLLTGWSGATTPSCRVDYRGSQMTLSPSNLAAALGARRCAHFPLSKTGDPVFRKL
jgi:hypothetical protein